MMHSHLFSGPSALAGPSGLPSSTAISEGALLNHTLNQPKEELKTQFTTREGTYKIMPQAEYSRPTRVPVNQQLQAGVPNSAGAPVRVSFLSLNLPTFAVREEEKAFSNSNLSDVEEPYEDQSCDRICFNVGREIYVYVYKGPQSAADLSKPIDKRVYKGTFPTCHHFNTETASADACSLLIGFSAGQIQLIDPFNKDFQSSRLYNEERFIDKSSVTCVKWVPGEKNHFLVSYSSGFMYLYNEDLQCPQTVPAFQVFKQGDKFTISTCKTKTMRNPVYRWQIGQSGAINQFAFSGSDAKLLATVGHDGYLRIFNYHQMELLSYMKSYFGGLLTLAWSPDAKLIATGGEDDLLTVYNVHEKRVICRGQGHKSWISQVSFDPYSCSVDTDNELNGILLDVCSEDDLRGSGSPNKADTEIDGSTPLFRNAHRRQVNAMPPLSRCSYASFGTLNGTSNTGLGVCYRIGSVGHDTQICLWDITEDMLKPSNVQRHRNSTIIAPMAGLEIQTSSRLDPLSEASPEASSEKPKKKRFHRRGFTLGRIGGSSSDRRRIESLACSSSSSAIDEARLLGTKVCPRMEDVPVIEPLICKKIAHERLTALEFRRDCIVTACQEGFICTWIRPGKAGASLLRREVNSPNAVSSPTDNRDLKEYSGHRPYWGQTSIHA
ncbi:unnamed protein product [Auanema sp. JU1783]|nr:unnamed protein product [Auanema sp. JU1783]